MLESVKGNVVLEGGCDRSVLMDGFVDKEGE